MNHQHLFRVYCVALLAACQTQAPARKAAPPVATLGPVTASASGPGYRVSLSQGLAPISSTGSLVRFRGDGDLLASVQTSRGFTDATSFETHSISRLADWGVQCGASSALALSNVPGKLSMCTLPSEQAKSWARLSISREQAVMGLCGGRSQDADCKAPCEQALAGIHMGDAMGPADPLVEAGVSFNMPLDFELGEVKPGVSHVWRHPACDLLVYQLGPQRDPDAAVPELEAQLRARMSVEGEIERTLEGAEVRLTAHGLWPTRDARTLQVWSAYQPTMQWLAICSLPEGQRAPCDPFFAALTLDPSITPVGLEQVEQLALNYPSPSGENRLRVDASSAPALGAEEPLVTLVVFSDLECPFCARAHVTLRTLHDKFPDTLRIVYRHNPLPFHTHAKLAAEASMEVFAQRGDAGFFAFVDKIFEHRTAQERADLVRYAAELGLDVKKLEAALDNHPHAARVEEDMAQAVRLSATGTPTFFLNGRQVRGAQPLDTFEKIVREEIEIAREMMIMGVERKQLYAAAMQSALEHGVVAPAERAPDPSIALKVPIAGSPARGPRDALVTVVEFADFQCPFCKRASETLKELEQRFPKDVRFVFKHNPLPFHAEAALAAEAAIEAQAQQGDAGFFRFHDALFERAPDGIERDDLESIARELGLNLERFARALDKRVHQKKVSQDQELARTLGAAGTPSFFINGYSLRGAQPLEAFVNLAEREEARARELVKQGTAPGKIYEKLQKDAAERPPATVEEKVERADLTLTTKAPSLGPKKAPVSVVMFTDFQCPFCSRVQPTLTQLRKRYPKHVRLEFRHYPLPFHTQAALAHEAAQEVYEQLGDKAFWAYHDVLFDNQSALARADLERYAATIKKLDMVRFRRVLDEGVHRDRVLSDMRAISDAKLQIGTPSFLINGYLLQGAQPIEKFVEMVERAKQKKPSE